MALACTSDGQNIAFGGSEGKVEIRKKNLKGQMDEEVDEDEKNEEADFIP